MALRSALFFAVIGAMAAHAAPAAEPRPIPSYQQLPLPDSQELAIDAKGQLSWLSGRPSATQPVSAAGARPCWAWELVLQRWNPATGDTSSTPLKPSLGGFPALQLPLPGGLLALSSIACAATARERSRLLLLPAAGGPPLTLETEEPLGAMPSQLLPLGESAAALVTRTKDTRHIKVYVIRRQGDQLQLDAQLPVLALPYRGDYAAAVAGTDRIMILGGSDDDYRGCGACRAETQLLDLKTRRWASGPAMLEARSELAAAVLPDGSILVSGGWTKAAGWGQGPSATAERWNPARNAFEPLAPMPTGNARHKLRRWTSPWGPVVLAVEGVSGSAQSFDPASRSWRTLASWVQGSEEGGCGFYPFSHDGLAYAWQVNRSEGFYSSKSCGEQKYASLSLLRPPSLDAAPAPPEALLISYRNGASFLPAQGSEPALLVGGSTHAGMNAYLPTATAEAIASDGRLASLPSLQRARQGAELLRVAGGVLLIGGSGVGGKEAGALPMEWLGPTASAGGLERRWQLVGGAAPQAGAAIAPMPDGSLLEIGEAMAGQLRLVWAKGAPTLERSDWPSLNRERRSSTDRQVQVRGRALADGRIVVAGGEVRAEKIALLTPDIERPDAPDAYVAIGDFLPSRRHEIFDPASRRWSNSAPSRWAGGAVFIFADGRVAKLGQGQDANGQGSANGRVLEISNAAGTAWSTLPLTGSHLKLDDRLKLFAIDDELLASGELDTVSTGGGPSGVEWLNPATQRWELLWQAAPNDNWRNHVGRVLRRSLVGSGGKTKTLIIPVEGL